MKRTSKSDEPLVVRTTGRIKKAKIVFDPSDNYLPKHLRHSAGALQHTHLSQSDHASEATHERKVKEEKPRSRLNSANTGFNESSCYICGRRELKRNKNKLISCKDCEHQAHISCLHLEFEDQAKLRENFRCEACQICSSCYEGTEDGDLITCTKCVKSFHFACHIPSMARFPTQTKWLCSKCTIPKVKSPATKISTSPPVAKEEVEKKPTVKVEALTNNHKKDIDKETSKKQLLSSPMSNLSPNGSTILQSGSNSIVSAHDLSDIPVVKNWSTTQVTEYFTKFFPNEAEIFKNQDIDGQSLLLLKRSDVVNRLAIKLGPALRIYNLVLKIQSVSTDPTIGW